MKRIFFTILGAILLYCVPAQAGTNSINLPKSDGSGACRLTGEATGDHCAADVNIVGSATATVQIEVNTARLKHRAVTSFTVVAGATGTYTLPAAADYGSYEIKCDAAWENYYVEDASARMLLKSDEHAAPAEGSIYALPNAISIHNPGILTGTYYIIVRYQ